MEELILEAVELVELMSQNRLTQYTSSMQKHQSAANAGARKAKQWTYLGAQDKARKEMQATSRSREKAKHMAKRLAQRTSIIGKY